MVHDAIYMGYSQTVIWLLGGPAGFNRISPDGLFILWCMDSNSREGRNECHIVHTIHIAIVLLFGIRIADALLISNTHTKWYRCYFIEIENYEKHIHISLENIVSSIFFVPCVNQFRTHTHAPTQSLAQFSPFSHLTSVSKLANGSAMYESFRFEHEMKYVLQTSFALWILFIVLITFTECIAGSHSAHISQRAYSIPVDYEYRGY